MNRAAAVPVIVRRQAGRAGAVAGFGWVWGRASVAAILMTLSLVLAGEGAPGDLDPSFGVGGKVTTDFGAQEVAEDLVLQPDGKLVAAGSALARYRPDGRLDPSFGVGGKVTTDFGASALVRQPDGKLVVAGTTTVTGFPDFALARYLPDGTLDASFGVGGTVITDFGGGEFGRALVLQPDGKLVVAGLCQGCDGDIDFILARYLADGSLDAMFGVGGKVTTDFGGLNDRAFALVLQPDGKLVAAGGSNASGTFDFALARYESQSVVNDLVSFEPIDSTFHFTPHPAGCPSGFVGTFSFDARLTDISASSLSNLVVQVTELTNGNLLQNADGGPGGVGAQITVPQQEGFTDGVLSPDEFVEVPFVICVTAQAPFTFVVDVLGDVDASLDAQARAPLVR
jgi:uncharacterized delta-60 repeat protein